MVSERSAYCSFCSWIPGSDKHSACRLRKQASASNAAELTKYFLLYPNTPRPPLFSPASVTSSAVYSMEEGARISCAHLMFGDVKLLAVVCTGSTTMIADFAIIYRLPVEARATLTGKTK